MLYAPDTSPIDLPTFHSVISLPYTLTPGRCAGTFLAEMPNRRIVGSRFADGSVVCPAQDFSSLDGEEPEALVQAPETGTLTGFTRVGTDVIGLIRLDGCANEFPHRILADLPAIAVGMRVAARWSDDDKGTSILAIEGFVPAPDAPQGEVKPLVGPAEPLGVIPYAMALNYEHAYGPYYGRMFDEIREGGRVMGVRGSGGDDALLPPREIDDITHKRTGTWKACADTGTIRACSIINMEVYGQTRPVPYVYAEIVLDGASTRMIHMIDIDDLESAKKSIKPGTRVRAIWTKGERKGAVSDIERFEVIDA
ncbi:OB-fold domain-containing protein [Novosphingobium lentum]|uniref:OB-fold domain-containing protein n=1 Tax=Novosphingobium lentum TaxID=145287 RepID=UPI00082C9CEF|nr:OB-fold domain-containing protein [Novosphingobium lentum]